MAKQGMDKTHVENMSERGRKYKGYIYIYGFSAICVWGLTNQMAIGPVGLNN